MCAYYDDQTTKIRKDDQAHYQGQTITILSVKHIKATKTMEINYTIDDEIKSFAIAYHASVEGLLKAECVPC